jgi:hypothetical protein
VSRRPIETAIRYRKISVEDGHRQRLSLISCTSEAVRTRHDEARRKEFQETAVLCQIPLSDRRRHFNGLAIGLKLTGSILGVGKNDPVALKQKFADNDC